MASPQTTVTSSEAWSPDVIGFMPQDVIGDALILKTSTVAGQAEGDDVSVRVPWYDADDSAAVTAEGDTIDEAEPTLAETVIDTAKVATLLRVSREQYRQSSAAQLLSTGVQRAIITKSDDLYLNSATDPKGLLEQTIIDSHGLDESLDGLADLMAELQDNGAMPDVIVASPAAMGRLRKFKVGADFNASLLGAGSQDMQPSLFGVPLLVNRAVPAGDLVVIDSTQIASVVGSVELAVSDQYYFDSDSIAIRCTFRFGAKLMRDNVAGKLTVTDPDVGTGS